MALVFGLRKSLKNFQNLVKQTFTIHFFMRSCRPYDEPSSIDDIQEGKEALDDCGDNAASLAYISALVRSRNASDVQTGLDRINSFKDRDEATRTQLEYFAVLALFRLHRDSECIARAKKAKDDGFACKKTLEILKVLQEEEKRNQVAIGVGVGVGVGAAVLGILGIIFGASKRK